MKKTVDDHLIRIDDSLAGVSAAAWNGLLDGQLPDGSLNPFMRHEYLEALHASGSAATSTGWTPRVFSLWRESRLDAACIVYLKPHSYGEYVFDWAWANAYQQHGLDYYPKAVVCVPFTPVPGPRLLARTAADRARLVGALVGWCKAEKLSSLHLLFTAEADVAACEAAGLMLRHTVQFHWSNVAPTLPAARGSLPPEGAAPPAVWQSQSHGSSLAQDEAAAPAGLASIASPELAGAAVPLHRRFTSFDDFLASLNQEKRKKIRQERRKVQEAGITFRWSLGADISAADWNFFYRCYERTYLEHGNAPYLSRDFFRRMASAMPEHWLLFVAEHAGKPIASSLIAVSGRPVCANRLKDAENPAIGHGDTARPAVPLVAYGRYWGALARVDCLHFEACYYQPLQWCIEHGFSRFEGGAQGEHKMARALLPVRTTSAHWLAHPSFADAIERFLAREGEGIDHYLNALERRSPFKTAGAALPDPIEDPEIPQAAGSSVQSP